MTAGRSYLPALLVRPAPVPAHPNHPATPVVSSSCWSCYGRSGTRYPPLSPASHGSAGYGRTWSTASRPLTPQLWSWPALYRFAEQGHTPTISLSPGLFSPPSLLCGSGLKSGGLPRCYGPLLAMGTCRFYSSKLSLANPGSLLPGPLWWWPSAWRWSVDSG